MFQALQLRQPEGVQISGERTVYRVLEEIGLNYKPKRKPNGITKADKKARKSEDLIKLSILAPYVEYSESERISAENVEFPGFFKPFKRFQSRVRNSTRSSQNKFFFDFLGFLSFF